MTWKCLIWIAVIVYLTPVRAFAQEKRDSTKKVDRLIKAIPSNRITRQVAKSLTRRQSADTTFTIRSEELFMPYEGKIVRRIIVNRLGFDKNVIDTAKNIRNTITRLGNVLHNDSKEWMIRDLLFFKEKRPVVAYKLADNERFLRDQDFILDARIYILPVRKSQDSVDVIVVTRDVFSIGGSFSPSSATRTRFRIYDANLGGYGQRVQFTGLIQDGRAPAFGYEMLYRKYSVAGTLVNATLGYTQLDNASSYGYENEKAYYIRLDRPLLSPYTRFAGGVEISRNWSENVFRTADSLFRNYRYLVHDAWIGYNIGAHEETRSRSRKFVSIRGFDQHFNKQPIQPMDINNPIYNNRRYLLAAITFFRQDFFKTRYIYGFGRTEDVPYGQTISFLTGIERSLGLERTYFGAEAERSIVHHSGNFYTFGIRTGAFVGKKSFEDATLLLSASIFSKIIPYRKLLIRQSAFIDFTKVFNQRISLPLDINNVYGLQGFAADSVLGNKRLRVGSETLAFTKIKLLGFRFAPFTYAEMVFISPLGRTMFYDKPFFGLGGGIRTRNENLVFGTVELRMIYYPRVVEDISHFKISVSSNLRVKYTGGFVKAPSFVQYN